MPRVFLSHSTQDREFVEKLAIRLHKAGLDVWYDKWQIRIGDSIAEKIEEGIFTSDFLIVVLSKNSVKSKWVRRELDAAITAEIAKKGAFILPVLVEKCQVPLLLSGKRYASFEDSPDEAFQELLEAVVSRPTMPTAGQPPIGISVPGSLGEVEVVQLCTEVTSSDHTMYSQEPERGLSAIEEQCKSRLGLICAVLINNVGVDPALLVRESHSFYEKIGYPDGNLTALISRAQDDWQAWEGEIVAAFNYSVDKQRAARIFAALVGLKDWQTVRYFTRASIDDHRAAGLLKEVGFRISKYLPKPSAQYELTLPSWRIPKYSWSKEHHVTPTFSLAQISPSRLQIDIHFGDEFPDPECWPAKDPWSLLMPEVVAELFGAAVSRTA